jgi:DNA-binding response OmpR family regulator
MALRLGARDYLIKPVELDELIRVVGWVLLYEGMAGSHARNMMEWLGRVEEFVQRLKTAEGLPLPHELDAVPRSRGLTAPLSRTTSVRTASTTAIPVKARRTLKSRRS